MFTSSTSIEPWTLRLRWASLVSNTWCCWHASVLGERGPVHTAAMREDARGSGLASHGLSIMRFHPLLILICYFAVINHNFENNNFSEFYESFEWIMEPKGVIEDCWQDISPFWGGHLSSIIKLRAVFYILGINPLQIWELLIFSPFLYYDFNFFWCHPFKPKVFSFYWVQFLFFSYLCCGILYKKAFRDLRWWRFTPIFLLFYNFSSYV